MGSIELRQTTRNIVCATLFLLAFAAFFRDAWQWPSLTREPSTAW